jgi:hypothetical protein
MSCCNCCENTLNLGCLNACDAVYNTGIVVSVYYSIKVLDGETVIFTLNNLNENYTYTGQIIDPFGEIVNIEVDGIEYDCIEFSTKIIINQ